MAACEGAAEEEDLRMDFGGLVVAMVVVILERLKGMGFGVVRLRLS